MNDQEYIEAGAKLADGWYFDKKFAPFASILRGPDHISAPITSKTILAALAAQLIEQVDALEDGQFKYGVETGPFRTEVFVTDEPGFLFEEWEGDDRNMNTIRAIVHSQVLEGKT